LVREGSVVALIRHPGERRNPGPQRRSRRGEREEEGGNTPDTEPAEHIALDAFDAMALGFDASRYRLRTHPTTSARMPEGGGPADPPLRHSVRTARTARCRAKHRKGRFRWRDFRPDVTT